MVPADAQRTSRGLLTAKLITSLNWDSSSLDNCACKHSRVSSSSLSFSPKTFDIAVRKKVGFYIRSRNVIVHILIMGTISRFALHSLLL